MKTFILTALTALVAAAPAPLDQRATDAPYGNKKGLCYNDNAIIGNLSQPGSATWAYNWDVKSPSNKFQFIPMCWDKNCNVKGLMDTVKGGAPWVLGYNEPDMCGAEAGGSCTTPQDTFNSWSKTMLQFNKAGAKLVCPGITSNDKIVGPFGFASGLAWLAQFASIGNNPSQFKCDAQALHWYGHPDIGDGKAQGKVFIEYIQSANVRVNQIFGKKMDLWVTEFGPVPYKDPKIMSDFLATVIPFLNKADYVARYAPFKAEFLMDDRGKLNQAGNTLVSAW